MEPRVETSGSPPPLNKGVDAYYRTAADFAERHYPDILSRYRNLRPEDIGPADFFAEYLWCVYVSGFNSKVVDRKYASLLAAYGPWDHRHGGEVAEEVEDLWPEVKRVIGNRQKFMAVVITRRLLQVYGWDRFRRTFLTSIPDIGELSYMGKVMRHHLARNIGLDTVKPDRHLVRLAGHFGFDDAHAMCADLAGRHGERIGVVDLILFYAASTYGTAELR